MITHPVLQWVFTIGFACIALYLLWRMVSEFKHPTQALGHGLHVLMALDMIAMAWPWWELIPWWPQLILFGAATLWFLIMAVLRARRVVPKGAVVGHSAWHQVVHALMMGAMVWMVAVMAPGEGLGHAHHDHGPMSDLEAVSGLVLVVFMVVALLLELVDATKLLAKRVKGCWPHVVEHVVMAAMLLGMAGMCWLML